MHEMTTNITQYLYLSHSPEQLEKLAKSEFREKKTVLINLLLDILVCSITVYFYLSFVF